LKLFPMLALNNRTPHGASMLEADPQFIATTAVEYGLRQALERDEFVLHYQPKADLTSRVVVGLEALIRWQSPQAELVQPAEFIGPLERCGLIVEVGSWALRRAALDHRSWAAAGLRPPKVAVNVSPVQLREPDFVETVRGAIGEGISAPGIELEMTEGVLIGDIDGGIAKLHAFRGLGIGIAIDDFGAGYSSLSYLARLPVDTLKIDRSFVVSMIEDATQATVVRAIVSLARSLCLKVVAEGVETDEQARMLALMGCDEMQGYLFDRPLAAADVPSFLRACA
jgi:EAL domain-containing protein (putative c-di-GMP-specific phosphodiesterase class I)